MSSKSPNSALQKAILVLEELAASREPLRFSSIVERTGMPKASLHRMLAQLREERLVELDETTRTFELGLRLLALTYDSDGHSAIRRFAAPELQSLSDATAETTHLAALDGTEVVYVSKVESTQKVRMYSDVGLRAPVYCTGVGKALLAFRAPEERARIIDRIDFHRFTETTITEPGAFRHELERIATLGYAVDDGEHEPDIRCVAAPIIGRHGYSVASLSISAPAYRAQEQRESWIEQVTSAAESIGRRLTQSINATRRSTAVET